MKNQKGQALVILSLTTVLLMAFSGLALDAANIFVGKLKLQQALDAAAIAGIVNIDNGGTGTQTEAVAESMARFNLGQKGVSSDQILDISPVVTIDPPAGILELTVSGQIRVNTLFVSLVQGPRTVDISASASAARPKAVISLALDVTPSMAPHLSKLKEAAIAFVGFFKNDFDEISVISFNSEARLRRPMGTFSSKQPLIDAINAITAGGDTNLPNTNIASAIEAGRLQNATVTTTPANTQRVIVLFTDGAPTTIFGRFLERHDQRVERMNLQPRQVSNAITAATTAPFQYDSLFWLDPNEPNKNREEYRLVFTLDAGDFRVAPPCGNGGDADKCLEDYGHLDSKGTKRVMRDNDDRIFNPGTNLIIKEEHYNLALAEANYAKAEGSRIYVIGLGTEAAPSSDPYQDVNAAELLKPYFLRSLANDPASVGDPGFPGIPAAPESYPKGTYFHTADPNNLKGLFLRLARNLRIRLVG